MGVSVNVSARAILFILVAAACVRSNCLAADCSSVDPGAKQDIDGVTLGMTWKQVETTWVKQGGSCSPFIDRCGEIVCHRSETGDLHVYFSDAVKVDKLIKELPLLPNGMTEREFIDHWRDVLTKEFKVAADSADQYGFWVSGNLKLDLRVPAHLYELYCVAISNDHPSR